MSSVKVIRTNGVFEIFSPDFQLFSTQKQSVIVDHLINSNWEFVSTDDRNIGSISLENIDWKCMNALLDVKWISSDSSAGDMSQAVDFFTKMVFSNLPLNKLNCHAIEDSIIEMAFNQAGYKKEVTLRKHFFKDGKYQNVSWMSCIRNMDGNL